MKIEVTKKQMEMIWLLERMGNYGDNPEAVVKYLLSRALDEMLCSTGLSRYLRGNEATVEEGK